MWWLTSLDQLAKPVFKLPKLPPQPSPVLSDFGRGWLLWKAIL